MKRFFSWATEFIAQAFAIMLIAAAWMVLIGGLGWAAYMTVGLFRGTITIR